MTLVSSSRVEPIFSAEHTWEYSNKESNPLRTINKKGNQDNRRLPEISLESHSPVSDLSPKHQYIYLELSYT